LRKERHSDGDLFQIMTDRIVASAVRFQEHKSACGALSYLSQVTGEAQGTTIFVSCKILIPKFLFEHTLQRPWPRLDLFRPRPTQTLPVILSVDEVWRILSQLDHPTYYTCLATIYTCGLRISEGVNLQVSWIDSARMQLQVRGGKGFKDRYIPLPAHPHPAPPPVAHPSQSGLAVSGWNRCPEEPAHCHGADNRHQCAACQKQARLAAGVTKQACVHSLRHSWGRSFGRLVTTSSDVTC
jgi:integrase